MQAKSRVKVVSGDLITLAIDNGWNIAHGCNCQGSMGNNYARGIAAVIAQNNPAAMRIDEYYAWQSRYDKEFMLGTMTYAAQQWGGNTYNLYVQLRYGPAKLKLFQLPAFKKALEAAIVNILGNPELPRTLAMPLIGCGFGGGNKAEVLATVDTLADQYPDINLVVVEYQKD